MKFLFLMSVIGVSCLAANAQTSQPKADQSYFLKRGQMFSFYYVNPAKNKAFINFVAEEKFRALYHHQWTGFQLGDEKLSTLVEIAVKAHQKMQYKFLEGEWNRLVKKAKKDGSSGLEMKQAYQQMWAEIEKLVGAETVAKMHRRVLDEAVNYEASKVFGSYKGKLEEAQKKIIRELLFKHFTDGTRCGLKDHHPAKAAFFADVRAKLPAPIAQALVARYSKPHAGVSISINVVTVPGKKTSFRKSHLLNN